MLYNTLYSLDGRIVPEAKAVLPVSDRGFLYGDGLFETLHAYGPTVFQAASHLARLAEGLAALGFRNQPSSRRLACWLREAAAAADFPEAAVRLSVTRGVGPRGPTLPPRQRPRAIIAVTRYSRRPEKDYWSGVTATVASFRRQEAGVLAKLKTLNYLEQVVARREADEAGADEALLLNCAGLLCEGSASNLTLIKDGGLVIPDPRLSGALPGCALQTAVALARRLGIPVCRAGLGLFDLRDCEEAFLSGSLRELTPLVRVADTRIGTGRPGPVTRRLILAYRREVERECPGYRFPSPPRNAVLDTR